jgi:COMPASS component SWD1
LTLYVLSILRITTCLTIQQEDEEEVLKRRLKQEEEGVDIDTVPENQKVAPSRDPWSEQPNGTGGVNGIGDVDRAWADDDPDDDTVDCALKVIIEGQEEY